jgi:hypothetical protein
MHGWQDKSHADSFCGGKAMGWFTKLIIGLSRVHPLPMSRHAWRLLGILIQPMT